MLELDAGAGIIGITCPPGEVGMAVVVQLQDARGYDAHDHGAGDPLGGAGHVWGAGGRLGGQNVGERRNI